jgi:hypothetical protein
VTKCGLRNPGVEGEVIERHFVPDDLERLPTKEWNIDYEKDLD